MTAYHTETIERDGLTFRVEHHYDHDSAEPWSQCDGHGPISDWERRDKRPGELILNSDHSSKRFYDFAEACRIARRDGWDTPPYGQGTPRQRAARAAMADFKYLQAWCNDDWHYCGVTVELLDEDDEPVDSASLWGIESNCAEYLADVAQELAAELASTAADSLKEHARQHSTTAASALDLAARINHAGA